MSYKLFAWDQMSYKLFAWDQHELHAITRINAEGGRMAGGTVEERVR